jgi:hypothetical protein
MPDKRETIWIAVVIAALAAIFLAAFLISARSQAPTQNQSDVYAGVTPDYHLLELDKQALDEAYHQQLLILFNVYLKGGTSDSQYFQKGLQNARKAYYQASSAIIEREKLLRAQQKQKEEEKKDQPAEQPK